MAIESALGHDTTAKNARRFSIRTRDERYKERERRVLVEGGILIFALSLGFLVRALAFEGTLVVSESMEPFLGRGDYALTDHRSSLRKTWKRGEIILFIGPKTWDSKGETLVKRIVGLPGEVVQIYDGFVLINGQKIEDPYRPKDSFDEIVPPIRLKNDEYYVMGDNRNHSDDSRENGPIRERDIRGKLTVRLWPPGKVGPLEK